MSFQLLGQTVTIDTNRERYNSYRIQFQREAADAVERFQELYRSNTSLEMVIQNAPGQMLQCIQPAVDRCIQTLVNQGVLSVDETRFIDLYPDVLTPANEAYLKIQDQYAEIVLTEEEKDAYRVARRQGRGRWQGGGFGLKGAIKGAAKAGALNMVTGAGHMLFNGIAKIGSTIAARSKMDRIFRDGNTAKTLDTGIYQSVFSLHYALIDCLDEAGIDHQAAMGIVGQADQENASAVLRNVLRVIDPEQQRTALLQAFQLDPYQENWYRTALQIFGDQEGTLETAERYFGISVIREEKERQLNKFVQKLPIGTEELAQLAVQKIEAEKARLNYSGETEQTKAVLDAVKRFDAEYRTVEGITFSTRSEADESRAELPAIQEIEQGIDYHSLASIDAGEQKIATLTSPLAASRRRAIQQKRNSLDLELRTVSTLLSDRETICCKTLEEADQLRITVKELKGKLDACGKGISAEQPLLQFKSELDAMEIPVEVKKRYQTEIESRLAAIDLDLRTALGKEYPTREAAKEAEQLYNQIRSDFVSGNPRKNGDKFHKRIESADFSEKVKEKLLGELFQYENAKEIKASKIIGTISSAIL